MIKAPAVPDKSKPRVVLDTNAALDWLVFDNPGMLPWAQAIEASSIVWLGCDRTRIELAQMVTHPSLARWKPQSRSIGSIVDRHCVLVSVPSTPLPHFLRCTDTDDQIFIDLAVAHSARWLLTHDKALLRLARRAAAHGVSIQRATGHRP